MTLSPIGGISRNNGLCGTLTGLSDRGGLSAGPDTLAPVFVSATILADGVTLRLVFTEPLTVASLTGITAASLTLNSGSIVGGNYDITIDLVYSGDSVGTIEYDGLGTLAGAGGAVAAFGPEAIVNDSTQVAWTPASLPGIVDYGIYSDLTRLAQNSDGSGAVTAVDDPIGWWRGQLDAVTIIQANAGNKPKYAADGVYFLGGGTERTLSAEYSRAAADPLSMALVIEQKTVGSGRDVQISGASSTDINSSQRFGVVYSGNDINYAVRSAFTTVSSSATQAIERRYIVCYNGSTAKGFLQGSTVAVTAGANATGYQYFGLRCGPTGDTVSCAWVVVEGDISDTDAALLDTWMQEV